jgi:hypothetical protein
MMPESRKCAVREAQQTSVARQRLGKHCSRSNELTHVSWQQRITEESTVRLGILYSVRMKLAQYEIRTAREKTRGQRPFKMQTKVRDSLSRSSMRELL